MRLGDRQLKMENRSALRVRLRPKSAMVRGYDGRADGQPQSETERFGGVKRLEKTLNFRG
jgi:hypothetical protein